MHGPPGPSHPDPGGCRLNQATRHLALVGCTASGKSAVALEIARHLGDVTQPVLVYRSAIDHVVGPASMEVLLAGLPKEQVTVRECADSYHVATLDNDAEAIFEGSVKFVQDHAG